MNVINKVAVEFDGQLETNFKTFKEGKRTLRRAVNLMHKTAKIKATARYSFSLEYAIPEDEPERDFDNMGDSGTCTIEYENGKRITYTGVSVGEIGEVTYDEEKDAVKTVDFLADNRVEE